MKDFDLDVFDVGYLMHAVEEQIIKLIDDKKKVAKSADERNRLRIRIDIWKKLLYMLDDYDVPRKKHRYVFDVDDIEEVSDGYHTFKDLYHQRMMLFSVICDNYKDKAWKSWKHHSGDMFEDYFIVGIDTPEGQYTYHYHKDWWDTFDVKELENAPEWDGHEAKDVIRLFSLIDKKEDE